MVNFMLDNFYLMEKEKIFLKKRLLKNPPYHISKRCGFYYMSITPQ